jgi:hypothetical protein
MVPHGALQGALGFFEGTLAPRGFLPNASTPVPARAAGPDEFGQRTPLPIDRQLKTYESIRQLHPNIVAREAPADMPSLQAIRRTYVVTALGVLTGQVGVGGAVPVFLAGRAPDSLASADAYDTAVAGADQADAVGDVQDLDRRKRVALRARWRAYFFPMLPTASLRVRR